MQISEVKAASVRDEVVDLLWQHRHWPGSTREDYVRLWEWRYSSLAEGEPRVWAAREPGGGLMGHVAMFPRRFRVGATEIRCMVPGDVLVHADWRKSGVGGRLLFLPKSLVTAGRFDMVLVMGNALSHRVCLRLGYHDLGTHHLYVDVRRTGPWLKRRFAPAAALAPGLDALGAGRRRLRQRGARRAGRGLRVETLNGDRVRRLRRTHWAYAEDRLVAAEGEAYLAGRFLDDPLTRREMFALIGESDGTLEGLVTVEYRGSSAVVCDCRVNADRLDEASAIALVGDHLPDTVSMYSVPALPGSLLARALRAAGFLHRTPPERGIQASAFWRPDHPAAAELRRLERWSLYTGAADA